MHTHNVYEMRYDAIYQLTTPLIDGVRGDTLHTRLVGMSIVCRLRADTEAASVLLQILRTSR